MRSAEHMYFDKGPTNCFKPRETMHEYVNKYLIM